MDNEKESKPLYNELRYRRSIPPEAQIDRSVPGPKIGDPELPRQYTHLIYNTHDRHGPGCLAGLIYRFIRR